MSAQPYAGLLPCPHCGGKPHMPYFGNRVECEDCESSVCGEDAWNRRTEAISSLLNALTIIADEKSWRGFGAVPTVERMRELARAALNSDASTQTVGEGL